MRRKNALRIDRITVRFRKKTSKKKEGKLQKKRLSEKKEKSVEIFKERH